jgi:transcriptional regulator with XRE-family HTH domain
LYHVQILSASEFAWGTMDAACTSRNIAGMGKPIVRKPKYPPTQIRAWRKKRGLTLEQLALRIEMDPGNLSRLERGLIPYNQDGINAIADALSCDPADLVTANPTPPEVAEIAQMVTKLPPDERDRIIRAIQALVGKAA